MSFTLSHQYKIP